MNGQHTLSAPSWQAILSQTETALACGALRSFETRQSAIEDGGMRFILQNAVNLARKEQASKLAEKAKADNTAARRDPFSPCEAALRVGDIGERHFLLLNKFNVLAHHLLIVTSQFESQDAWLNEYDFAALFACFDQFDGLGFYNGGTVAGSSQPHKHLQIVPLPLDDHSLPIEPLIEAARSDDGIFSVPQLPFAHAAAWLDHQDAHDVYRALLLAIGIEEASPYNLLVTRRWMMAVPRAISHVEGVAVNALGFAGSLFVRDDAQRAVVESLGPMKLLARACGRAAHNTP
ncbi:phosphorylase [Caballeronia sp. BR00000012568055]|uniref:ATP adenylyltransferase family protein n=1 Tax=Caballeronia sp. BR00000012568055 TaxID=2918761 RepID=UPI0023F80E26|nr:phosphorylase [Caballeronia sp. BR00000012568055]